MSTKILPASLAVALAITCGTVAAPAQAPPNTEFQIRDISVDYVGAPQYNFGGGPRGKRTSGRSNWLEIEVTFDWQPRGRDEPDYLDDLVITYYVLLDNASRENPEGVLLKGQVAHVSVPQDRGLKSVMYIAPRTIERFFGGKQPATARGALRDVGITIARGGQMVAESSWQGQGAWWEGMSAQDGFVLNKDQSPFAPILWEYYEMIKPEGGGGR